MMDSDEQPPQWFKQRVNAVFGRMNAIFGLIICSALFIPYIYLDAWVKNDIKPIDDSIIDLLLAVIPSLVAVGFWGVLAWVFIGRKLSSGKKDISSKELELTGEIIKKKKAKPIPTLVFPEEFATALSRYKNSVHIAVLTAEAVNYYRGDDIQEIWDGKDHSLRRRIIVLLPDRDGGNHYGDLYKKQLPRILTNFEKNGEIFLVSWDDLVEEEIYHPCIKDCAVFQDGTEYTVFTNYIGESFLRLTKSPFRAYQFQSSSYGRRIVKAFESALNDQRLKNKSKVLKDQYRKR